MAAFELAAELETGSRLPTGEYTPPDTTQLDLTCSVFNFSTKSVGSSRELVANSIHCGDSSRLLSRVGVVHWALRYVPSGAQCLHYSNFTK